MAYNVDVADSDSTLKINTPLANITATGLNAAILLAIGVLCYLMVEIGKKVDAFKCTGQLSMWVNTQPKGGAGIVETLPVELWGCVPEFMYRRK